MPRRAFKIVLIKPSHYDADGYVIQWWRSTIPSNSLASVYGLLSNAPPTRCSAPTSTSTIEAFDECNTVVNVKRIDPGSARPVRGFVGLIGVQSNQFPRALDLGRQFRAAGYSGCHRRLPCQRLPLDASRAAAGPAGGARSRHHAVSPAKAKAAWTSSCATSRPARRSRSTITSPICRRWRRRRSRSCRASSWRAVAGHYASFDAGRGCPFQCSFCTIINVQGRKSRYRTPDDIEAIVRANAAQGITRFFITDDNFARNTNWEPILDRLIELREDEGFRIQLVLQVDTLCHRIPSFIEKAARAGCNRGVHRAREHQSRIPDGHQEAPEQDLGIPRDAPGVAQGKGDDLRRLHPRLPDRHAGDRSRATSRSSRKNCRSISWSSSASRRCRAPRITRSSHRRASRWTPT